MARDGGAPQPQGIPDPLTPELAPFVVQARARFSQATDGLDHDAAVEHLEAAVAQAEIAASRLGFQLPTADDGLVGEALALGDGSVVVVQRFGDLDPPV
jgi:hypothetical protein